jgi:hypothetical protein
VQVVGRRIEIGAAPEPPPEALVGRIVTIRRADPRNPAHGLDTEHDHEHDVASGD